MISPSEKESWSTASLRDCVTFQTGKLNSNAATADGAYPFFTCSQETYRTDTYSFDTECVLLAGNNANGIYPLKYFRGKFDAYQRTYVIRSTNANTLDNRYLYYALRPKLEHLKSISTGAATKFLTLTILNEVKLEIPPISVQRRIASILSAYDDLIENSAHRIRILEDMAQMIFREWFVNFRFPGHKEVKMAASDRGMIPAGWQTQRFTDISEVLSGGTPKTTLPEFWNGDIPFFGPTDSPSGFFVTKTEKSITRLGLHRCNSRLYPAETVFITARGTVGKIAMPAQDTAMNQSCYALRGKGGLSQLFLFMLTKECTEELKKKAHGAVFDAITIETFSKLPVVRPADPLPEQFEVVVRPLFSLMLALQRSITNLQETRDLLLPKLVLGEIEVGKIEAEAVAQDV